VAKKSLKGARGAKAFPGNAGPTGSQAPQNPPNLSAESTIEFPSAGKPFLPFFRTDQPSFYSQIEKNGGCPTQTTTFEELMIM